jgi:hypothetical protein
MKTLAGIVLAVVSMIGLAQANRTPADNQNWNMLT